MNWGGRIKKLISPVSLCPSFKGNPVALGRICILQATAFIVHSAVSSNVGKRGIKLCEDVAILNRLYRTIWTSGLSQNKIIRFYALCREENSILRWNHILQFRLECIWKLCSFFYYFVRRSAFIDSTGRCSVSLNRLWLSCVTYQLLHW